MSETCAIAGANPSAAPLLLVVDDREENLIAMQALLGEDAHWQLRCVNSGENALRCLLQEDISLVLLDVQMPEMDGYEVAALMRSNPRTRYTPIIFISAISHTQDSVLRGYSNGAVDFILKPFDSAILRHKIHNLLAYENNRRELQRLSQQLERERAFNASILANAAEGIVVVGEDGNIQYANPAMANMLSCAPENLLGRAFGTLFAAPENADNWQQSAFYSQWRSGKICRLDETQLHTSDGNTLPVTLSCAPLPLPQRAVVVILRDISVERELHRRLEALTITDPLTGLLNRRGFYQALETALARIQRHQGRHLAVIYLDLDGFKRINDSLGHESGDELLRRVAKQIKSGLRSYDALARLGGDEFTVLLDSLYTCSDAARVAEKIMQRIEAGQRINGVDFSLSASVGIACWPECGHDVESLLRAADMAMYEAKRNGRQQYHFYSPQMTARAHARLQLEQHLRQAIEQECFEVQYQPQYHLESGRLRGFEALLRWPRANNDAATPEQFIPLLEETRLIHPLGQWILSQGIAHLAQLRQHFGSEVILSLNISPVQFALPQLVENLAHRLRRYDLEPAQLEVEMTEHALMQNLDTTRAQLRQLRELGVKISMDDFGTGYSSLAYLRQFELDTLKIDRRFIANIINSPHDAAIVNTIIDLGQQLGLQVIAEGVETVQQRQWLLEHHCTVMQGWLVAPALPLENALTIPAQLDWDNVPLYHLDSETL